MSTLSRGRHISNCASLCTNFSERRKDNDGPCEVAHSCWCPQGRMSYDQYQAWSKDRIRTKWARWQAARELAGRPLPRRLRSPAHATS